MRHTASEPTTLPAPGDRGTAAKQRRRHRSTDAPTPEGLARALGGELVRGEVHASVAGNELRVRLPPAGQAGAKLVLSVSCAPAGGLQLTRRTWLDQRLGAWLPHRELSYGSPRFRHAFLVQTRDSFLAGELLRSAAVRAAIDTLFAHGAVALRVDGPRVEVDVAPAAAGKCPEPDAVRELALPLGAIGAAVTDFAARRLPHAPRHDRTLVVAWTSVLTALALGATATVVGHVRYSPLDSLPFVWVALGLGGVVLALFVVLLSRALARRTAPGRDLMPLALVSLPTWPLLVYGLLVAGNGLLDPTTRASRQPLQAQDVYTFESENKVRVRAVVDAPAPGRPDGSTLRLRLRFRESALEALRAGTPVWVDLRPGAFGVPWLADHGLFAP